MSFEDSNLETLVAFKSTQFDLSTVSGLIRWCQTNQVFLIFPIKIQCPSCSHQLTIKALDDFPWKSVICKCEKFYLLKLIQVHNGKETIL